MLKPRTKDMLRRFLIAIAAAGSAVVLSAGPATAAPYWQPYTSNPHFWHCSDTPDRAPLGNGSFYVQACLVRNGSSVQAVGVITNTSTNATASFSDVFVKLEDSGGSVVRSDYCYSSQLPAGLTRACFGKTITTTRHLRAVVENGDTGDFSPWG
jgi:hypothetical protein